MSIDRRSFLQKAGMLSGFMAIQNFLPSALAKPLDKAKENILNMSAEEAAKHEDF